MGNYISCTLAGVPGQGVNGVKVILPTGNVRQLTDLTNAADLMLEIPGHFLVDSRSLHVGRRFSALPADEELEMGGVYVLFPMRRVNSVVTAADMGALMLAASSAVKRAGGGKSRVLPEMEMVVAGQSEVAPRLCWEEIDDGAMGEFKARLSASRSKKPKLETIVEEAR